MRSNPAGAQGGSFFEKKEKTGSRCSSTVKWWNEKINKNKRSRVRSPARATFFLKKETKEKTSWAWLCENRHLLERQKLGQEIGLSVSTFLSKF
jgi:hypothetical protein